jgi:hypothetical protein
VDEKSVSRTNSIYAQAQGVPALAAFRPEGSLINNSEKDTFQFLFLCTSACRKVR